jgi:N-sulfoglucosamine sulfohydrolase
MNRRTFMGATAGMALASTMSRCAGQAERPNILWLTFEDTGTYDFGCYGNTIVQTPNADALAARGIRFTNASSCGPQCSPARSTIISGCWATTYANDHHRSGRLLPEDQYFFPKLMRETGYFCTNNSKTDYNVAGDQWKRMINEVWDDCSTKATYNDSARKSEQPFFAVFNNTFCHMGRVASVRSDHRTPRRIDPGDVDLPPHLPDLPEIRDDMAWHMESVEAVDVWLGKHLQALADKGLADDTIVFFFSDHGGTLPRGKAFPQETGYRIPFLAWFPPKWEHLSPQTMGNTSDRLIGFVDLAPTVLSMAGISTPEYMDGEAFFGTQTETPREYQFNFRGNTGIHWDPVRTASDGRYKYIRNYTPYKPNALRQSYQWLMPANLAYDRHYFHGDCKPEHQYHFDYEPTEALYDLQSDPWELNNLADKTDYQTHLVRLRNETSNWVRNIRDLGFIPSTLRTKSDAVSLYEWVRETNYPLDTLIEAAETASMGDVDNVDKLTEYLDSDKPEIRFWGASGFTTLAQRGLLTDMPAAMQALLLDTNPEVACTAAEAYCWLDQQSIGMPVLVEHAKDQRKFGPALSALEELREKARPCIPAMKEILASSKNDGQRFYARSVLITLNEMSIDDLFEPAEIEAAMKINRTKHMKPGGSYLP